MPLQRVVERDTLANQPLTVIDQQPQIELRALSCAAGKASRPSRNAARATEIASMLSDFPRPRTPRGDAAISLVVTRRTRSPRRIRNRSNDPETCRQSSIAHTRSPPRRRAHANNAANPLAPTCTVCSPTNSPVVANDATIVCERLCASAPSTIMTSSTSTSTGWTPGGHGLLRALPRSYQVTPDIPDRRRATQRKVVRPNGRQPERESARRRSGTISTASDITDTEDQNSKPG